MAATKKQRLDALVVERGLADTIETARRLIGAGCVLINEMVNDKAGAQVATKARVTVKSGKRYVSRGGDKLQSALHALPLDPTGLICADIGSSTGGFSDCLLQHGAQQVYCVDVGYGLLDWKLRSDARVVVLERTNARYLNREHIQTPIDLAVIDASFISLEPLLPPLLPLFAAQPIRILALVKPQFQLPRELIEKGGVVTDEVLHRQALNMVESFGLELGLHCEKIVPSGVRGAKGNQEFFMLLTAALSREAGEIENGE
ncbi:MAG: TlyA family RNA methyltransferase [Desulfobulbus sp.]|nr:TlyA family RNA methyltransferase [Desulfobulbus sp.]